MKKGILLLLPAALLLYVWLAHGTVWLVVVAVIASLCYLLSTSWGRKMLREHMDEFNPTNSVPKSLIPRHTNLNLYVPHIDNSMYVSKIKKVKGG